MSDPATVTIVDYGTGNLNSIRNMLRKVGVAAEISSDPGRIEEAGKLILPGVGAWDHGLESLHARGLRDVLDRKVLGEGVPVLGICLGMQLLAETSEEGQKRGLGWIEGHVARFDFSSIEPPRPKIPHMGWNEIQVRQENPVFDGLSADEAGEESRFYFVHSYHFRPTETDRVLARARHGLEFTAVVGRDNVLGVQFHPEKSHKFGMKFLENFARQFECVG